MHSGGTSHHDYGVLERAKNQSSLDPAVEEVTRLGFSVIGSGMSDSEIGAIKESFDRVHAEYIAHYGLEYLQARDEHNTVRLPLARDTIFLDLAVNPQLLALIERLIKGKFILNQQNGIVNPANDRYNQDQWHRDLPYQHFTSSRPIAINALYCVDDFTEENGSTGVLPATHHQEIFPSDEYVANHAQQVTAPAGSFIIIDAMTYHRGERNRSTHARRAVNHLFAIPHIKQQISIPSVVKGRDLEESVKQLLGFSYSPPPLSVDQFLDGG